MENNTKETTLASYRAPKCKQIEIAPQSFVCGSETENVGEKEGEW